MSSIAIRCDLFGTLCVFVCLLVCLSVRGKSLRVQNTSMKQVRCVRGLSFTQHSLAL